MKVLASVPLALICQGADSRPPGILRRCQHLSGRTAFISVLRLNLPWNRPRTASNLWLEGSPHSPPLPTSAHCTGPLRHTVLLPPTPSLEHKLRDKAAGALVMTVPLREGEGAPGPLLIHPARALPTSRFPL